MVTIDAVPWNTSELFGKDVSPLCVPLLVILGLHT
eukprot:CAMPEP_0197633462 /NCGR_PEP_ID=MMETSP1338-20131121/9827_1 /TAXON_ID=43686 ORGANISM="Pelagodinium beii, Strain RCC1491" /NCGR_SAMPLE_ID=MMETSP1338 /ASSEMBLY_ACC=CAM_ASM_000754 /LENGTH=34 /DNA_ID= /DNA_START= /DNA_END= /DNA_ORIENTATION=